MQLGHNKLSGKIPSTFANFQQNLVLDLSHNSFTFDGMQSVAQKFSLATYSNQAKILLHQNSNALTVSAGGSLSNNTYRWSSVSNTGSTLVATIKGDSVFHPSQSGTYSARVTNSIATQLTLISETFNYVAPSQFASATSASSENALQLNNRPNKFLVYPNPAKDILHVQTNGDAAITLSDPSGKILFIKSINGKQEINVANLAAGIYYLKNNSSGATQKVIIAK